MRALRPADGEWSFEPVAGEKPLTAEYQSTLRRYLGCLEPAFDRAKDRSEFEFIMCLLRVRGMEDMGWDPYITTFSAIDSLTALHETLQKPEDIEASRHLELWMYGHMVEASEPYELVANLLHVALGGRWHGWRFPPKGKPPRLRPQSPGEKIDAISALAAEAQMPDVATPLVEIWDRDLRNAIFHADYSLHGYEIRILRPVPRRYQYLDFNSLVNRAHAFHQAMRILDGCYRGEYVEPAVIPVHPEFSPDPDERAMVVVREGYGVIAVKDAWSLAELAAGRIPWFMGMTTPEEESMRKADPTIAFFPKRSEGPTP